MRRARARLFLALVLGLASACRPSAPDPQLVAQWLRSSLALASSEQLAPPAAARTQAYASIALYEGYAADPRSRLASLAGQANGLWRVPSPGGTRPVDGAAAAAAAVRVVLDSLFGEGSPKARRTIDSLADAQLETRRRAGVKGDLRERSVSHGRTLGNAILAWAASDGSPRRGSLRPAATTTTRRVNWGALRTFALRSGDECAPPPLPPYSQRPGSEFWKMGKELYDSARAPSSEQQAIARFWADSLASTQAPGVHWTGALNQMITIRHLSADQAAEAFMLTAVAIADAFIGGWRDQDRSHAVSPMTYVNRVFDRRWSASAPEPLVAGYALSQATVSGAAAGVLIHLLGDSTGYADSTQTALGGPVRTFRGFSHALDEGAISGVYAGLVYVRAARNARALGQCAGDRAFGRLKTRPDEP